MAEKENLPATKDEENVAQIKEKNVPHEIQGYQYGTVENKQSSAWLAQKYANENVINTEILEWKKDREGLWVKMKATDPKTGQYVIEVLDIVIEEAFEKIGIDLVDRIIRKAPRGAKKTPILADLKNPFTKDDEGRIIPNLTPRGQIKLTKELVHFRYYSLRTAQTQLARRLQLKLLNKEWREEEEVKQEQRENEAMENLKAEEKEEMDELKNNGKKSGQQGNKEQSKSTESKKNQGENKQKQPDKQKETETKDQEKEENKQTEQEKQKKTNDESKPFKQDDGSEVIPPEKEKETKKQGNGFKRKSPKDQTPEELVLSLKGTIADEGNAVTKPKVLQKLAMLKKVRKISLTQMQEATKIVNKMDF